MKTSGITVLYGDDSLPLTRPASLAFYCGRIVYCLPWSIVNLKSLGLIATFSKNQCLHLRHRNEFRCLKSDCISASVIVNWEIRVCLQAEDRQVQTQAVLHILFLHGLFRSLKIILRDHKILNKRQPVAISFITMQLILFNKLTLHVQQNTRCIIRAKSGTKYNRYDYWWNRRPS